MTLTSETVTVQYDGDGAQTAFAIPFIFWGADDPQAILTDAAGVETIWARGTQYTVTGGNGTTGTLNVVTSPTDHTPALGETLTIKSDLANTQPTSLPAGGAFPSSPVEQQFDQTVRQIQQEKEELGRAVKLKVSSTEKDVTLDDLTGNVGKFTRVNSAEDGLEYASVATTSVLAIPVSIAEGGTAGTTEATARSNLNLPTSAQQARTEAATNLALFHHGHIGA